MNGLIEWWARNTVAANLLMVGIILAGIFGFTSMEKEMFPQVRFPGLQIQVAWPGAGPTEVEDQIVARIEESVRDLDNVEWVRSSSSEGFGAVYILAEQSVDFTQFMNDVKIRVDSISSFPRDIEPPQVQQWVNRDEFIRVALSGQLPERDLKRLAEKLRREAAQLPGVNLVELFGVRREEVSVEVSEENLRRYNLSFANVATAIRNSSINLSGGNVRTDAGAYTIAIRNRADTQKEFGEIIVRQQPDGGTIRVKDVATVVDGFEDFDILATLNGEPAVLLQVMTTEVMDIVKASQSVNEWIEKRQESLPVGATLTLWTDEAEAYNGRMTTITNAAGSGLILVLIVLLLSLRPKVAFWVAAGIATAYAGAFVFLPALDVSINMLSTFAFLLVLGIVVDDAIVVGESIHTESQKTGGGITAAVFGTQLVAKPVVFAVLTTIIAFVPWIMIDGSTSEFTRHITWVVITALFFSLVESLLILPAHLSHLKPREKVGAFGRFQKKIAGGIISFAENHYRGMGQWSVNNRYLTTAIFIAVFMTAMTLFNAGFVKKSFNPDFEEDEIRVNVNMPEGSPYSRALEVLTQLQDAERTLVEEVEAEEGKKGTLIENWYTRSRAENILAIVKLAPPEVRTLTTKDAAIRLRELLGEIPDAKSVTVEYKDGNNDPGFELSVRHPDLDILREAVADLEDKMRTYDILYDVRNNLAAASEEIRLTLRPGAEKLGLNLADVSRQVRQAYFGEEVQRLPRAGQDVKVMVRLPKSDRRSVESLEHLRIRTNDGREVPLLSVVQVEFAPGIKSIQRWNFNRAARVSADMKENKRGEIMEDLEKNFFPQWEEKYPGLIRGSIGQAEGEARFVSQVIKLYLMAIFAMYMLIAVAFKSYWQPIAILVAIPYAFAGAVFGHFTADLTMAIFSYFGIAAAAGVVVNDNLVLMDYCNRLRERGLNAYEAVVEAGVARFRPILLTSVTTFVGLVPMMLERSIQAAFLKPIVVSLASGVLIAFFVTLFMVPALYAIGEDLGSFFSNLKSRMKGRGKRISQGAPAE
ncbi:efflux RND transporter permease subunit [Kordiimonas laminariae]|uniref:efflux RND transporter permease subunit n=1 Tax=Kordiimonas laminariae TaxID=2917717 RepID=UPI001FF2A276|nr:efflux RND transporter permease subunit [Kordiimonas laminariae]MCK0068221.1 efflux RND transporter permease subunit [Kordiimonas laminariae]